jgi:hypothetical protein
MDQLTVADALDQAALPADLGTKDFAKSYFVHL